MPTKHVPCPNCKTLCEFSPTNPYRPFCSERCRLIDLGQWAEEAYRVPVNEETPSDSDLASTYPLQ